MKKLILVFIVVSAFTLNVSAQTKKIAHRSHSGKNRSFTINGEDNFGGPGPSAHKPKVITDSNTKTKDTSKIKTTDLPRPKVCKRCARKAKQEKKTRKI